MKRSIIAVALLLLSSVALSQNSHRSHDEQLARQVVNPQGISPLVPAYSVAIRHDNMVFVSGMIGFEPGTQEIVDGGITAQTRQTLQNIRTTLQSAGASMSDVAECTVFLVDMADYTAMSHVYVEFFPEDPPARATLAVSALPKPTARVQIKCSAVVQEHRPAA